MIQSAQYQVTEIFPISKQKKILNPNKPTGNSVVYTILKSLNGRVIMATLSAEQSVVINTNPLN